MPEVNVVIKFNGSDDEYERLIEVMTGQIYQMNGVDKITTLEQ